MLTWDSGLASLSCTCLDGALLSLRRGRGRSAVLGRRPSVLPGATRSFGDRSAPHLAAYTPKTTPLAPRASVEADLEPTRLLQAAGASTRPLERSSPRYCRRNGPYGRRGSGVASQPRIDPEFQVLMPYFRHHRTHPTGCRPGRNLLFNVRLRSGAALHIRNSPTCEAPLDNVSDVAGISSWLTRLLTSNKARINY